MSARYAVFEAIHMQELFFKIDLFPSESHQFTDSKPVAKHQENKRVITQAMPTVLSGGFPDALDFGIGQIVLVK
jgi:hypothetical protein